MLFCCKIVTKVCINPTKDLTVIHITPDQVNISLVVDDDEAEQCVRALHSAFFESEFPKLDAQSMNGNGSASGL